LQRPASRGSLRYKVNLCSHPRWPPAHDEGSRTCACERGRETVGKHRGLLDGNHASSIRMSTNATTIPNIPYHHLGVSTGTGHTLPVANTERASLRWSAKQSSGPLPGESSWSSPHEHPVAQRSTTGYSPLCPNHQVGRSAIEAAGQYLECVVVLSDPAQVSIAMPHADPHTRPPFGLPVD